MKAYVRRTFLTVASVALVAGLATPVMAGSDSSGFPLPVPVTFAQAVRILLNVAKSQQRVAPSSGLNPANATYLIDGERVTLSGGLAEQPVAPGSATKAVTKLSNWVAQGDLNGDGQDDLVAVLTHDGGGSGTLYYLAAVQHDGTPVEGAFLGDRIAVQNLRIVDGRVIVDLLTRGAEEPMAATPSIQETRMFEVKDGALVQLDV